VEHHLKRRLTADQHSSSESESQITAIKSST
jgi:hypothetical protein